MTKRFIKQAACSFILIGLVGNSRVLRQARILKRYGQTPKQECKATWGTFSSSTPFHGTRENTPPSDQKPIFWKKDLVQLYIDPPKNFAFCSIPKNSCTQWLMLMPNIFNNDTHREISLPDYKLPLKSHQRFGGVKAVNRLFRNANATRVVIIRDPLARLASAYLDKCFGQRCTNNQCYAREVANIKIRDPVPFRTVLDWMLSNETDVRSIDPHWRMQSYQCGLKQNIRLYTIIGYMEKSTLSQDATCIMEKAGLSRFNVDPLGDGNGNAAPFWKDHSQMTMGKDKAWHYRQENEEELLKKLFTTEYAMKIVELMREDYDLFHLPIPSWVHEATGEWLDDTDHHTCKKQKKNETSTSST